MTEMSQSPVASVARASAMIETKGSSAVADMIEGMTTSGRATARPGRRPSRRNRSRARAARSPVSPMSICGE